MLNPTVNAKIKGLFKAFECFSSTFQGKFNFKDFMTVLYIQVLFKPVRTPGTLANSEDPDEMSHKVVFHLSLHCLLLKMKKIFSDRNKSFY